jgi:adenylate cyclase
MRKSVDDSFNDGQYLYAIGSAPLLVEALLARTAASDLDEATAVVDRLAAIPGDEWVARDIMVLRLRTLLARARGDETGYCELLNRYRAQAMSLGFEGHIQWAESMS